ncbi:sigma-54-dependent Fis family transcriptional regulator [Diaphorobacter ruginosibacter]|uniref:Sigma-54-dependent Fis family transcriptional regulator n=1 Tax=Diaphorobacter ruginosibacter TaxID=1715720 RepID=A0A7G9RQP1_9BURK|nr:sigma-54 dependent transcriptional regulator [Diaphorobacter ruginosibacter]QNN57916.1 sigma-54-dependent Fis family transcriptional regulator [Diaphorobacter ruginosibacter]
MKSILLIEDDAIIGESLMQRFEIEGMHVTWCRRLAEATLALERLPGAVVSDVRLPDGIATQWFTQLSVEQKSLPWFFLTGYGSVGEAIEAIRAGAREYLTKPFDIEALVGLVQRALHQQIQEDDEAVLGVSPAMRRAEATIRKVASQKVSVLLTGESGVGKEVAARLLHDSSPAHGAAEFVAVNCAAIPESMMEAEFFGYEKGAFTGAVRAHKGYLERANKGTLFLDELGELPAAMQAKLLRALQEKCFFRLGSERTTQSEFRIVAATNRDLHAEMNAGRFREDLFYRLAVIKVDLPPLRERPEDIRWLTEKLIAQLVVEQSRPIAMSEAFLRDLIARQWKGNARELRSYLEESVILSEAGILDVDTVVTAQDADGTASPNLSPLNKVLEGAERAYIQRVLEHCDGSVGKSANVLGISRKTLWEKMKRLELSV